MSAPVPHSAIWAILAEHCGAKPAMPDDFVAHFPQCREYRFMGALGFGGKVWVNNGNDGWYVNCYQEHETPERETMMIAANAALELLWRDSQVRP